MAALRSVVDESVLLSMELVVLLPCRVVVLSLAIIAALLPLSVCPFSGQLSSLSSSGGRRGGEEPLAAPMLLLVSDAAAAAAPSSSSLTESVGGRDRTSILQSEMTETEQCCEGKIEIQSKLRGHWAREGKRDGIFLKTTQIVLRSRSVFYRLHFFCRLLLQLL